MIATLGVLGLFDALAGSPPAPRQDVLVAWSDDGTHVQVGNRVHRASDGAVRKLPPTWRYSDLSPDGTLSARVDGAELMVVGEGRKPFTITIGDAVTSWLSTTQLLVIQRKPEWTYTCATVTVDQPAVTPVACPASDYHALYGVVAGPDGQLAVQSSGEGHPGVNFVTWSADQQAALAIPPADLYPGGPLVPSFARGRVFAHTPCDLRKERGCPTDRPATAFVFSAKSGASAWTLVHEGLPAGLHYDAVHDRFAWAEGSRWCLGDLTSAPTCRDQ